MRVGEVVEMLIYLRDKTALNQREDDAVCAACNILDQLPNMMETDTARAMLEKRKKQREI